MGDIPGFPPLSVPGVDGRGSLGGEWRGNFFEKGKFEGKITDLLLDPVAIQLLCGSYVHYYMASIFYQQETS